MQIGLLKTGRRFSLALLCLHWLVRFAQEDGRLLHLIKRKEEIVRVKTGEGGLWTLPRQGKAGRTEASAGQEEAQGDRGTLLCLSTAASVCSAWLWS